MGNISSSCTPQLYACGGTHFVDGGPVFASCASALFVAGWERSKHANSFYKDKTKLCQLPCNIRCGTPGRREICVQYVPRTQSRSFDKFHTSWTFQKFLERKRNQFEDSRNSKKISLKAPNLGSSGPNSVTRCVAEL